MKSHYNLSAFLSLFLFFYWDERMNVTHHLAINILCLLLQPLVNKLHKELNLPTWWIKCWRKLLDWNVIDEARMCRCCIVNSLVGCTECLLLNCWCNVQLSIAQNYTTSLKRLQTCQFLTTNQAQSLTKSFSPLTNLLPLVCRTSQIHSPLKHQHDLRWFSLT